MEILDQLSSWPLYGISGVIILFVMAMTPCSSVSPMFCSSVKTKRRRHNERYR